MKHIVFIGDSITEARPGVSYIKLIEDERKDLLCMNYGKGGDTIKSVLKRIGTLHDLDEYDTCVLYVGVNEVLPLLNRKHMLFKRLSRQVWTSDINEFKCLYKEAITYLKRYVSRIVCVTPACMGEDFNNDWNKRLLDYVCAVKEVGSEEKCDVVDVYSVFQNELKTKTVTDYLPHNLRQISNDFLNLNTDEKIDGQSKARGLYLTLDGVHINSNGAHLIKNEIIKYI